MTSSRPLLTEDLNGLTIEAFLTRATRRGRCLEWSRGCFSNGYGRLKISGRSLKAHRVSWVLHKGSLLVPTLILHHCDNPPCVDPLHLFDGSHADNIADMDAKGRRVVVHLDHRGMSNPNRVLTIGDVDAIRAALAAGQSGRSLARQYGVWPQSISNIKHGHTWATV
jgi:hypothetical protein